MADDRHFESSARARLMVVPLLSSPHAAEVLEAVVDVDKYRFWAGKPLGRSSRVSALAHGVVVSNP